MELSLTRAPLRRRSGTEPDEASYPPSRPSVQAPSLRFCPLAQKEQQPQRRRHPRREDDAERGPRWLPACRQSRKLLLNDLKIEIHRGGIGARLIRPPQR